jgi:serine/threonine protein kinase
MMEKTVILCCYQITIHFIINLYLLAHESFPLFLASDHSFNISTHFFRDCMSIPKGWLCYLSPEIMRSLRVHNDDSDDLPFTKASDVYAFGTVWYEMLTGEWPWKAQPPETIIW